MRKFAVIIAFLLFAAAAAGAETVLLYIGDGAGNGPVFRQCMPISAAIEDGVMNEYFENGHIIFNAGVKAAAGYPEPPGSTEPLPVRIAKAGGASYLLEVEMIYNLREGELQPSDFQAGYIFSNVHSSKVLQRGSFSSKSIGSEEAPGPEESGYRLGQMLARETLAIW